MSATEENNEEQRQPPSLEELVAMPITEREARVQLAELVSYSTVDDSWHLEREPAFIGRSVEEGLLDGEEVSRWRHSVS